MIKVKKSEFLRLSNIDKCKVIKLILLGKVRLVDD